MPLMVFICKVDTWTHLPNHLAHKIKVGSREKYQLNSEGNYIYPLNLAEIFMGVSTVYDKHYLLCVFYSPSPRMSVSFLSTFYV